MEMCPNASQIFDIYLFIYSFQDMTSTLSNNNLLCILIGKVLINDSLILHYHKNKRKKEKYILFKLHKQDYTYNEKIHYLFT